MYIHTWVARLSFDRVVMLCSARHHLDWQASALSSPLSTSSPGESPNVGRVVHCCCIVDIHVRRRIEKRKKHRSYEGSCPFLTCTQVHHPARSSSFPFARFFFLPAQPVSRRSHRQILLSDPFRIANRSIAHSCHNADVHSSAAFLYREFGMPFELLQQEHEHNTGA